MTLENRILTMIWRSHPVVHDSDDKGILAICERDLLTAAEIKSKLPNVEPSTLDTVLEKLTSHKCVARVFLYPREELYEQLITGDKKARHVRYGPSKGQLTYQVTDRGKQQLDLRLSSRFRASISSMFELTIQKCVFGLATCLLSLLWYLWP